MKLIKAIWFSLVLPVGLFALLAAAFFLGLFLVLLLVDLTVGPRFGDITLFTVLCGAVIYGLLRSHTRRKQVEDKVRKDLGLPEDFEL